MNKIIFLVGPTASGKTDTSVYLAKKLNAEIISCDSMQVYKGVDVLSQKPSPLQRSRVRHHMISIVNPSSGFNAADYRHRVEKIIKEIFARNRIPLVVGGSGLYIKALIDGLFSSDSGDKNLRLKLEKKAQKYGNMYLYNRLKRVDPDAAVKIHPNNIRRVIRALEIYDTRHIKPSKLHRLTKGLSDEYDIIIFGIRRARTELYERINKRVEGMFKRGAVSEARALKRKRLSRTSRAVLGYKEISAFLDGKMAKKEAEALLKRNTRRYAKRQITWFRQEKRIIWIDAGPDDSAAVTGDKIMKYLQDKNG